MDANEVLASCLSAYSPNVGDNIIKGSQLLAYLRTKGAIRLVDGGSDVKEHVVYDKQAVQNYDGESDPLTTTIAPIVKDATFSWIFKNTPIKFTQKDDLSNAGKARLLDLFKLRVGNAEKSMRDGVEEDWFSDGTGTGMKGSRYILSTTWDGTGSAVGGIAQSAGSTGTFTWCHYYNTTGTSTFNTSKAGVIIMTDCMSNTNYDGFVDLIATTPKIDSLYRVELILTYSGVYPTSGTMGKIGFAGIPEFMGAPVIGSRFCPTGNMYGYNTNHIFLKVSSKDNFRTSPLEHGANSPHIGVAFVFFTGAITVDTLRSHWLADDITG